MSFCATVSAAEEDDATVISLGLIKKESASFWMLLSNVAEKKRVWRIRGNKETIFSTSGMKPMSSIRSASSITRILTSFRSIFPRSK